jgi:hypothetical protein
MKAFKIIPIFFLVLFFGFQMQVNAQASASVSYTIVVTEDMLAGGETEPRGFGFDFDKFENGTRQGAASNVSVSLQANSGFGSVNEIAGFETEMDPADSAAILGVLNTQFTEDVADLHTDSYTNENGQYMVVMEYN